MNWTITINIPCFQCQQLITEQDISQSNYQLILLPVFTIHHQVCPKPSKPCSETSSLFGVYSSDRSEQINLNINLK